MSTPSQLPSQGTLEGASSPKSRVRITVLTILALHVVVIGGLLLQGCDKGGKPTAGGASNTVSALPPLVPDTNYFSSFPGDGAGSAAPSSASGLGQPGPGPGPGAVTPGGLADAGVGAGLGTPGAGAASAGGTPSASQGLPPVASTYVAPPASSGHNAEHVIKKGDTIGTLAKKYGVTEQAIIDANPTAKPRNLKIDEKLVIPPPAPAAATPAASAASGAGSHAGGAGVGGTAAAAAGAASGAAGETYVVKQGDTLSKVAKKFGLTIKQLRDANAIKGDRIVPKQRLTIPAKPSAPAAPSSRAGGTAPSN